jgi:hypothetical protein
MSTLNKPLMAAIIAASTITTAVEARTIDLVLLGNAQNQLTDIQNLPNASGGFDAPSNIPALYQAPRIGGFTGCAQAGQDVGLGCGWPGELELRLNLTTSVVEDYKMTLTGNQYFSAAATQTDFRVAGRHYRPGPDFQSCNVTDGLGDGNGILKIDCSVSSTAGLGRQWVTLSSPGYLCGTENALDTTIGGSNGCGRGWGPNPATTIEAAASPFTMIPANASVNPGWGGHTDKMNFVGVTPGATANNSTITWGLQGTNAEVQGTTDALQNARALGLHHVQGVRSGGFFSINHTGNDAASFQVTSIDYQHETSISFPNGIPSNPGFAQSFTAFTFDHIVEQNDVADESKNVPAMGAFGLAALFGGLVAVAARLRRRVS